MFVKRHRFKVYTGTRYLGGFIGDDRYKRYWMREHTLTWEKNIGTISKTADKHPQKSYATVAHAIKSE